MVVWEAVVTPRRCPLDRLDQDRSALPQDLADTVVGSVVVSVVAEAEEDSGIVALAALVAVLDTKVVVVGLADRLPPTHPLVLAVDEVVALVADTTATEVQPEAIANPSGPEIAMATAIDGTMTATVTVTDTETATGIATATGTGIATASVIGMEGVRSTDGRDITTTMPMMTLAPKEDTESSLIHTPRDFPSHSSTQKYGMLVGI